MEEQMDLPSSQRRTFLVVMASGISAVLAGLAVWPMWEFLSPRTKEGELGKVEVPRDAVPLGGAHFFQFHGRPAVVLQMAAGDFTAFSAVCTHLGCVVKWQEDKKEFLCPCHAGRFSAEGKVLGGPPPKPLEELSVSLQDDKVMVG